MPIHPLHKMIAPRLLLAQIRSTVPYRFPLPKHIERINGSLADKAKAPFGWWDIIHSAKNFNLSKNPSTQEFMDYFALCLAAHHCTVGSYVPTDVDTKIRNHLWRYASAKGVVEQMCAVLLAATQWERSTVAAREVHDAELGALSGLDGEWLSVFIAALLAAEKHGLDERGETLWQWVCDEIQREAQFFKNAIHSKDPLQILKAAAILSHNAGDIDQGIESSPNPSTPLLQQRLRSIRFMAKDKADAQTTCAEAPLFALAADIYKSNIANEFHRHYPLREMKVLREHEQFAFPLSPFLDEWGAMLAQTEQLNQEQKVEILGGLIHACDVVQNQRGYYRAISGFLRANPDRTLIAHLPVNLAQRLQQADMQQHIAIDAAAFAQQCAQEIYAAHPALDPASVQFYCIRPAKPV